MTNTNLIQDWDTMQALLTHLMPNMKLLADDEFLILNTGWEKCFECGDPVYYDDNHRKYIHVFSSTCTAHDDLHI